MNRPSKKEMKAAVDKLKRPETESVPKPYLVPPLEAKKTNKNRARKQGI